MSEVPPTSKCSAPCTKSTWVSKFSKLHFALQDVNQCLQDINKCLPEHEEHLHLDKNMHEVVLKIIKQFDIADLPFFQSKRSSRFKRTFSETDSIVKDTTQLHMPESAASLETDGFPLSFSESRTTDDFCHTLTEDVSQQADLCLSNVCSEACQERRVTCLGPRRSNTFDSQSLCASCPAVKSSSAPDDVSGAEGAPNVGSPQARASSRTRWSRFRDFAKSKTCFPQVVRRAAEAALQANGGCGIIVLDRSLMEQMQKDGMVLAPVDKDERFPEGYMNHRMSGKHIDSPEVLQAIREFTDHSSNDRWPADSEAAGLPMDGYIVVDDTGLVISGAVRLQGLPSPSTQWDGVGTRHIAALAFCEAARSRLATAIVRSDAGTVHGLSAYRGKVRGRKCLASARLT